MGGVLEEQGGEAGERIEDGVTTSCGCLYSRVLLFFFNLIPQVWLLEDQKALFRDFHDTTAEAIAYTVHICKPLCMALALLYKYLLLETPADVCLFFPPSNL